MKARSVARRRTVDRAVKVISGFAAMLGIAVLFWILSVVLYRGIGAINWQFFVELPAPPGVPGGGLANALLGTFYMTLIACLIGLPVGIFSGIFLAEFAARTKLGDAIRFATNVLMGIPSIIIGLFVYAIMVVPLGRFSGWAGAVALAILMLPVVARTTEDMLSLVPDELREAALALGASRVRVTFGIVFRAARAGLLTGVLLAIARIAGETAPLLFTALNSPYWPTQLDQPTANLTVTIFNYAMSPYQNWQQMAWGASLIITVIVLFLSVLSRLLFKEVKR